MRNQQRELNDIKFDYTQDSDTVDGIAHELVTAEVSAHFSEILYMEVF